MRFSVVIPCFDKGAFLGETLETVARQTHPAHEIIVVDDGSTDPYTRQRLRELCRAPIQLIEQANAGPSAARNAGIARATGDFILPLDADDLLTPDALERYAQAIAQEPSVDIWYPDIIHFGIEEDVWEAEECNPSRLLRANLMVSSAAIRRRLFDEGVRYNEAIRIGFEDWEFYIHAICEHGASARPLGAAVFRYRRWGYSRYDLSREREAAARQQIREERPIYRDPERRLELKRRHSPAFVIAADGAEVRRALDAQEWRDVRIADETGLVRRRGDLALFQSHPGRLLLVGIHERALARALERDRRLLEKIEIAMRLEQPRPLWLAAIDRPSGVFPGVALDEADLGGARVVGVVMALEDFFAPAAIPRSAAGLWTDLARALDDHGRARAMIVTGVDAEDEPAPPLADVLVRAPSLEPSAAGAPRFGRDELRERASLLGKALGLAARAVIGPERYEKLWRTGAIARLRRALTGSGPLAQVARGVRFGADSIVPREGPIAAGLGDRARRNIADIAADEPTLPLPAADEAGDLLIVAPAVGAGAAGELVADLVDAWCAAAPELRVFLIATGAGAMSGAERVVPRLAGFFHVPEDRGEAAAAEIARLAHRLGVATLLVADSRAAYDAVPLMRQGTRAMRVVSHLFDFDAPTGKPGGFPIYAASRSDALIDTYVVGAPALAERLTREAYVSLSKIRVIARGADRARWARELGAVLLPGSVRRPRLSVG